MKHPQALTLAQKIQTHLREYCTMIEIAGSIRRGRPECGDVDLVVLPKPNALADLKARCQQRARVIQDGPQNFICRLSGHVSVVQGFQLDIFIATPESDDMFTPSPTNFGSLMLCRTGSKEHNIFLIERAKEQGLRWQPYQGILNAKNEIIASRTEEEIFTALKLDYVPPDRREIL